jgi:hypothetical protein
MANTDYALQLGISHIQLALDMNGTFFGELKKINAGWLLPLIST